MRKILLILLPLAFSFFAQAQNITRFEYFFDTDPGYGAGTIVNVTPAATIADLDIPISTSSLSTGFHKLYMRAQNATNQWTHTHLRSFYIVALTASTNITQIEYFIDTDPGIGSATQVSFTASAAITNLAIDISTVPLTPGFHKLYVRSKSSDGQWTHTHLRSFYIVPFTASTNITQIEYFIDTDPGIGSATQVSFTAASTITNLAIDISAVPLAPGFHKLYVRSKSTDGQWTHTHLRSFYVANVGVAQNLVKFEYFFDTDPGFDSGVAAAITPAVPSVTNQDIFADVSSLTVGPHTIYVRAKDSGGEWTQVSTGSFSVTAASPPTISSFTPTSGPVGTTVSISGTNFSATPANNIVYFGATRAAVNAASTNQLTVTVPVGATYQPITVNVGGLIAYSAMPFTVTFPGGGTIDACSFAPKVDFPTGINPWSVSIGDLDGDGKADLAIVNLNTNTVSVFRNTSSGAGSISYAAKIDFTTGADPNSVSIGDLDGDGKADLAVTNFTSSTVSVFRNTSSGAGNISYAAKVDLTTGTWPYSVSIGDLDGDGKADLAVANGASNTVSVFRNTSSGVGNISYASKVDFTTGSFPISVSIGDLDGDGKVDLAVGNNGGNTVSVFRNTSSGAGNISYASKVDFPTGVRPVSVFIGDLDGDGKADLAVANSVSATVSVFRNTSSGAGSISYATRLDFTTGADPQSVSIGNLDGDGKADIAVTNEGSPTVSVYRNTSTGFGNISYAATVDFTAGTDPRSVSIGDLDGDGKADLAVVNSGSNTVSVFRNTIGSVSPHTIASFTPLSGPTGTSVTITGTNFDSTPANNIVKFNGTTAIVTASTATSITTTVPVGATTGTITVMVGCNTAISSGVFTVGSTATININTQPSDFTACTGQTATFTTGASGAINIFYQWQKFDGSVFNNVTNTGGYSGATTTTLAINTTGNFGAGDYRCKVSGELAPDKFSTTVTLTVNPVPTAPTVNGSSNCIPAAITLTASGGTNGQYRWYDVATGGTAISGQVNSTYSTSTINTTTTYHVSINNGLCESVRTAVIASIIPLNKPALTSSRPIVDSGVNICDGENCTLSAPNGFTTYTWSNGDSTPQIIVDQSGVYSFTVTDASNCVSPSSDPITLTVNLFPVADITADGTQLTASSGDTYQWYQNGIEVNGATNQSFEFDVLEYGVYVVDVTDNGCTSTSAPFEYLITGLEKNTDGLKVYPNPVEEKLFVEYKAPYTIHIINTTGTIVSTTNSQVTNALIDFGSVASGVYILQLKNEQGVRHYRITKL